MIIQAEAASRSGQKPRAFIGSSTEGKVIARHVQVALDQDAEVTVWDQGVFGLSQAYLADLVSACGDYDFAVLIATPDDTLLKRGKSGEVPRDNVIFELGLFMGALGPSRTFIICPRDQPVELPSDLAGVSVAKYGDRQDGNLQAAVGAACTQIWTAISRLQPRSSATPGNSQPPTPRFDHGEKGPTGSYDWPSVARRLLALLEGEDRVKLAAIFRDTVPHRLASWIKRELKERSERQRQRMHDVLERIYGDHIGRDAVDADFVRQNCCYYMCNLRTPYSRRFLENALQTEQSLLVKRGIFMGLALTHGNEEPIQQYLQQLRSDEYAASVNAGYHQCYYGDKFFMEGCLFDPTVPTEASINAIFAHLQSDEHSPARPVDLFTLRYVLLRSSTALLTPQQRAILADMASAGNCSEETRVELDLLSQLLESTHQLPVNAVERAEFLVVKNRYLKRLICASDTQRLQLRYRESIYIDGRFYLASKITSTEFSKEVTKDKAKAKHLVAQISSIDVISSRGRLNMLELGCSYGTFLDAWQQSGLGTAVGIDLSPHAIEFGKQQFPGLILNHGDASNWNDLATARAVDLICCLDFLEHCFDIDLLLHTLATVVRRGTLLLVYMPILEDMDSSLETLLLHHKYNYTEHIWFFTRQGLAERFAKFGFHESHFEIVKRDKCLAVFEAAQAIASTGIAPMTV